MRDIIFNIIDWQESHEEIEESTNKYSKENEKYIIKLFGRTEDDQTVYLKVLNFTPYFYIKLPNKYSKQEINYLVEDVRKRMYKSYSKNLIEYEIVKKHDFYGFRAGKKFKFLMLIFNNVKAMRNCARVFNNKIGKRKFAIYESNIEPMLRFMHIRQIDACGWVKINEYVDISDNIEGINMNIQIECNWQNIHPYKTINVGKFKICSYDIECTSSDGSFPQASRLNDKIIQIGSTFNIYGEKECYLKHIITLDSCDPIDGVIVEHYKTEKEVILAWIKLIKRENPDIMTGYNICGFDEKYIHDRAVLLKIHNKLLKLGRINEENYSFGKPFKNDNGRLIGKDWCEQCGFILEHKLSSSGLGDNKYSYFRMLGRVKMDLMKVIQRDFKLPSYKLDNVLKHFIRSNITSVEGNIINTKSVDGLYIENFICIEEDGDVLFNGKKFQIIEIGNSYFKINSEITLESGFYQWCLVKDDVKPQDIFKLQEGTSKDRSIIAKYCVQDCATCNLLITKLNFITNNMSMANVSSVPLSYIFIRGQGIKSFSLVSKFCRLQNHLIPVINNKDSDEKYEGAVVLKPRYIDGRTAQEKYHEIKLRKLENGEELTKKDKKEKEYQGQFFNTPIFVLDFASLYPNSMREGNISHETLVMNPKYDNLEGYDYYDVYYKEEDKSITHCRYARNKNGEIGILPNILKNLLSERKAVKKLMEKENDPFKKSIYDGHQLALKLTANSLYGQTGAKTSAISLVKVAASTTAIGRKRLEYASDFAENYFKLLAEFVITNNDIDYNIYMDYIIKNIEITDNKYVLLKYRYDVEKYKELIKEELNRNYIYKSKHLKFEEKYIRLSKRIKYKETKKKLNEISIFKLECKIRLQYLLQDKYTIKPMTVYGDSVPGYTPILVKINDQIDIMRIDDFQSKWEKSKWEKYGDKEEMKLDNIYVWSNGDWSQIKRVIRHKTNKKIYRINTHIGIVDVTEDHSLLDVNENKLQPIDCKINTELLHSFPTKFVEKESISKEEAWIYGLFYRDGYCNIYNSENYEKKYNWELNNSDNDLLLKVQNINKLVPTKKIKDIIIKYRSQFYNNKYKKVPKIILNGTKEIKKAFLEGYLATDRKNKLKIDYNQIIIEGQIGAMGLFYLYKSLDYEVTLISDKSNIYKLIITNVKQQINPLVIKKKIILDDKMDYVYDLETTSGIFQAGIGEINVHNTDSVFINGKIKDKITDEIIKEKDIILPMSIELGILLGDIINQNLPFPQNLEYEKTFYPLCLIKKKKYTGNLYEFNPYKFYRKDMGIVLKRRDNARIVKKIVGGIVEIILNNLDVNEIRRFVENSLSDLLDGKYKMDDFVVTKTLKAKYKDRSSIAHVVLADRIAERDPGNALQVNDRVPYIYIVKERTKKSKQGEFIETPDYIIEQGLKIDYLHYIENQIMNPSLQFLSLVINDSEKIFNKIIIKGRNKQKGIVNIKSFTKSYNFDHLINDSSQK